MSRGHLKRFAGLIPTTFGYGRGVMSGAMEYVWGHPDVEMLCFQEKYPPAEMLREWGADGLLGIFSKFRPVEPYLSLGIPILNVSSAPRSAPVINVRADQIEVGRLAAEHLKEKGVREFAYLGVQDYQFSRERGRGFAAELPGKTVHTYTLPPSMWAWLELLHEWVKQLPKPCGVFCAGDNEARMLLSVCRTSDVSVPEELAILGANNEEDLCMACTPTLSSIPVPARRIGVTAMSLLVDRVAFPDKIVEDQLISPSAPIQRASSDVLYLLEDPAIADTLRYIRAHIHEGIGVDQVAAHFPGSRRTFEIHFKKRMGRTPLEEIHAVRLERIQQLLRDTELTLAGIAERSGIATVNHLCAFFKKHKGESPGSYRAHIRRDS